MYTSAPPTINVTEGGKHIPDHSHKQSGCRRRRGYGKIFFDIIHLTKYAS